MAIPITKKKLLIGEGDDEETFFGAFLAFHGILDVQVLKYEGKTKLAQFLAALPAVSGFADLEVLGVTRDADENPEGALQSIDGAVAKVSALSQLRVERFVLPGTGRGALEDLVLASIQDGLQVCVDEFLSCARAKGRPVRQESKARMHALLATGDDPGLRMGEAAKKKLWDFAHPTFTDLAAFVRALRLHWDAHGERDRDGRGSGRGAVGGPSIVERFVLVP